MGGVPRKPTEEEERRSEAVALKARRIATLPGSQRLKVGVASSVLSNKMVWGLFLMVGVRLTQNPKLSNSFGAALCKGLTTWVVMTVVTSRQFLKWDTRLISSFFGMSALHECPAQMVPVSTTGFPTPFLFFFPRDEIRALGKVGCDWSDLGIKTNQGSWQLSMPFGFSMKCAHCFSPILAQYSI